MVRAHDLLEELPFFRSELFRKDVAAGRGPGVGRVTEKDVPGGDDGGNDINVELQVDLREAGTTDEADQITFGVVGDSALRHLLYCVGKLCGFPAMQQTQEAVL